MSSDTRSTSKFVILSSSGDDIITMTGNSNSTNSQTALNIGLNFTGSTVFEAGLNPPDTMGAVGPSNIVELINGRYSVYDKSTGIRIQSSSLDEFWRNAGVSTVDFSYDPRILYDSPSDRWFAVSGDSTTGYLIGVSKASDPTKGWIGFEIPSSSFVDFPTLGLNAEGVYINSPSADEVIVIPKADLINGSISRVTVLEAQEQNITLQPVVDLDRTDLPYSLYSYPYQDFIQPTTISGSITSPKLTKNPRIPVTFYPTSPGAKQPLTNKQLSTLDLRLTSNLVLQNGSVWGAQTVGYNGRAAVRWFEIDEQSKRLKQEGLITDKNLDYFYGSIAVDEFNNVVIGFNGSSNTQFVSSFAVLGKTSSGVTTFDNPLLLKESSVSYKFGSSAFGDPNTFRWGDYSATVVDPTDPFTFWTFQEYAFADNAWGTQITQLKLTDGSGSTTIGGEGYGVFRSYIDGGNGKDTITLTGEGGSKGYGVFQTTIDGGTGKDIVVIISGIGSSEGYGVSKSAILADSGNDFITITGVSRGADSSGSSTGYGMHQASVDTDDGNDTLIISGFAEVNSGTNLTGTGYGLYQVSLNTGNGKDTLTISGSAEGNSLAGFTGTSYGVYQASVDTGNGDDTLMISGSSEDNNFANFTGAGYGVYQASVDTGNGNDTLTISGSADGSSFDDFTGTGYGVYQASVDTDDGNDTLNISGSAEGNSFVGFTHTGYGVYQASVDTGNGNDALTISGSAEGNSFAGSTGVGYGVYQTSIDTGNGNDTLIISGSAEGNIGNDFTGTAYGVYQASVDTGNGNDALTISGFVKGNSGTDFTGTAYGLYQSSVDTDDGNDTLNISGSAEGNSFAGFTDTGYGVYQASVDTGNGNDVINISGTNFGIKDALISGGDGNDTFNIGTGKGIIDGGYGKERILIDYFQLDSNNKPSNIHVSSNAFGDISISGTIDNIGNLFDVNGSANVWTQTIKGVEQFLVNDILYTASQFVYTFG